MGNVLLSTPVGSIAFQKLALQTLARSKSLPVVAISRLETLTDQYSKILEAIQDQPGQTVTPFPVGDNTDLEALDVLLHPVNWADYPRIKTRWVLDRLTTKFEKIQDGKPAHLEYFSMFEMYKCLEGHKIRLPDGALRWAICAKPGDQASFYDSVRRVIFEFQVSADV